MAGLTEETSGAVAGGDRDRQADQPCRLHGGIDDRLIGDQRGGLGLAVEAAGPALARQVAVGVVLVLREVDAVRLARGVIAGLQPHHAGEVDEAVAVRQLAPRVPGHHGALDRLPAAGRGELEGAEGEQAAGEGSPAGPLLGPQGERVERPLQAAEVELVDLHRGRRDGVARGLELDRAEAAEFALDAVEDAVAVAHPRDRGAAGQPVGETRLSHHLDGER